VSLFFGVTSVGVTAMHPADQLAYYLETYGEVLASSDPQVGRAHQVFERVRAVADKNGKRRRPRLVVVDSPGDPWAIALPDGHIILSRRAVSVCHQQANNAEAEARLAFVLGHELAHLARDDFLTREASSFLPAKMTPGGRASVKESDSGQQELELAADDTGFIYGAIAGYTMETLVETRDGKPDFLQFWLAQTNLRTSISHPSAEHRASLLRERLRYLRDQLGFFHFGVRLSHFDQCDDAVYFLREFQKTFPGREVLNNLGFCYLQMARQAMAPARAYLYWMPLLLDTQTRASSYTFRGNLTSDEGAQTVRSLSQAATGAAQGFLQEAVEYLGRATQADPRYQPARLNLAVAWLYLGRPSQAMAILKETRAIAPADLTTQGLEALALYEQSEAGIDLWPAAIAKLEGLVSNPDTPLSVRFNLARLLEIRPRPAEARDHWNALARTNEHLPVPIRDIVCRKQSAMPASACTRIPVSSACVQPWTWPLSESHLARLTPKIRRALFQDWHALHFDWLQDTLHGNIYRSPDGLAEVLAMDQFVHMQVLKGDKLTLADELHNYCTRPLRKRVVAQGTVWSCDDWAALTLDGSVRELWWVAR
jgi:tetratricopeptide (TPR) repeat protein